MPGIYLYAGEANPADIRLSNPAAPRGWWPGSTDLTQEQNMGASGVLSAWGIVLYPMGQLVPHGGTTTKGNTVKGGIRQ